MPGFSGVFAVVLLCAMCWGAAPAALCCTHGIYKRRPVAAIRPARTAVGTGSRTGSRPLGTSAVPESVPESVPSGSQRFPKRFPPVPNGAVRYRFPPPSFPEGTGGEPVRPLGNRSRGRTTERGFSSRSCCPLHSCSRSTSPRTQCRGVSVALPWFLLCRRPRNSPQSTREPRRRIPGVRLYLPLSCVGFASGHAGRTGALHASGSLERAIQRCTVAAWTVRVDVWPPVVVVLDRLAIRLRTLAVVH